MQIESMDVTDADLIRGETLEGGNSKRIKETIHHPILTFMLPLTKMPLSIVRGETACKLLTMVTEKNGIGIVIHISGR